MLDQALSAATKPAAQTPDTVLQQLQQARELYESDQAASFQVVERLLADVDDAEVCLLLLLMLQTSHKSCMCVLCRTWAVLRVLA